MGFVYPQLPVTDPDYGRAVPCQCAQQDLEAQRTERLQRYSNLGPLLRMTFDTLSPYGRSGLPSNQQQFARALEAAKAFAAAPQGWLVFQGTPGSGKTHLAAAIANACIERGQVVLFTVVPDLLDHLRAAFAPQNPDFYDELFEQVRNTPLLILDDLGTQSTTPWAQEKLFQLLNHRYNAQLPTVITLTTAIESLGYLSSRLNDPALVQLWALEQQEEALLQYRGALSLDLLSQMTFRRFDSSGMNATPAQQQILKAAYQAALQFAQKPQDWLVLSGPVGCGKTHLAAAIANYQVQQGNSVYFLVVPDLLDHLRSTFAPESQVTYDVLFDKIRNAPLLILDDLGTQSTTPWAQEKLFQLLNHRYNGRLPTVITTNLDRPHFAQLSQALASRIGDPRLSQVIPIDAPDYRMGEPDTSPDARQGAAMSRRSFQRRPRMSP